MEGFSSRLFLKVRERLSTQHVIFYSVQSTLHLSHLQVWKEDGVPPIPYILRSAYSILPTKKALGLRNSNPLFIFV